MVCGNKSKMTTPRKILCCLLLFRASLLHAGPHGRLNSLNLTEEDFSWLPCCFMAYSINRREQFSRGRGHATELKYFPLFNTQICVNVKPSEAHTGPSLISWVHDIGQINTKPHTNITGGAYILLIVVVMIPRFCISFFFIFSSTENIYNALLTVFTALSPSVTLQRLPLLWFSFLMRPNNDQFPVSRRSSSPRGSALF